MAHGVVFGLVAALSLGLGDLLAVSVVRKVGIVKLMVLSHLSAVAVLIAYYLIVAPDVSLPLDRWLVLIGSGILLLGGIGFYFRSIQVGPVSLASPIVSTHAAVVILLAVLITGERLGAVQVMGLVVAVGGVVLASVPVGGLRDGARSVSQGALFALAAMLFAALFVFTLGSQARELGWFLPIFAIRLTNGLLLGAYLATRRTWPWANVSGTDVLLAFLVGVLLVFGLGAYAAGSEVAPLSVVAAVLPLYCLVPIAGGVLLFRERLAIHQFGGIASAIIGVIVLTLLT